MAFTPPTAKPRRPASSWHTNVTSAWHRKFCAITTTINKGYCISAPHFCLKCVDNVSWILCWTPSNLLRYNNKTMTVLLRALVWVFLSSCLHGCRCFKKRRFLSSTNQCTLCLYGFLCWESTYSAVGAKKVPQGIVLRAVIVHSVYSVDAMKWEFLRTSKWFLWTKNTLRRHDVICMKQILRFADTFDANVEGFLPASVSFLRR